MMWVLVHVSCKISSPPFSEVWASGLEPQHSVVNTEVAQHLGRMAIDLLLEFWAQMNEQKANRSFLSFGFYICNHIVKLLLRTVKMENIPKLPEKANICKLYSLKWHAFQCVPSLTFLVSESKVSCTATRLDLIFFLKRRIQCKKSKRTLRGS